MNPLLERRVVDELPALRRLDLREAEVGVDREHARAQRPRLAWLGVGLGLGLANPNPNSNLATCRSASTPARASC